MIINDNKVYFSKLESISYIRVKDNNDIFHLYMFIKTLLETLVLMPNM